MKLSDQALGAIMMALQKSLLEQSDITETLRSFEFVEDRDTKGLVGVLVRVPPTIRLMKTANGPNGKVGDVVKRHIEEARRDIEEEKKAMTKEYE